LNRTLIIALLALVFLVALFFVLRPDPGAEGPRERNVELAVEDGAITPDEVEVGEGDLVTLRMTTSGDLTEIHVHGYDLEREVAPGETTSLEFEADLTGRFEIEDHESGEVLGALLVRPR
jgi:Cupredoxin-like domain